MGNIIRQGKYDLTPEEAKEILLKGRWISPSSTSPNRPSISYKGKAYSSYKLVWIKNKGKIPKGMTIDHKVSIFKGLVLGWPLSKIHGIDNLQLLTEEENAKKNLEELKERQKIEKYVLGIILKK